MNHATVTFVVLGVVVALFIFSKIPVEIVAVGAALSLFATGVLSLEQAIEGFGDPAVIFIASLFVVSEGIDASGVSRWVGQVLMARAGESRRRLLVLVMLAVAGLSALVTINGAVSALLPAVVLMAIRFDPPSRLLLPLAFAAHSGSLLTLTGSPVNVIIAEAMASTGEAPLGYIEWALIGLPLLLGTIGITLFAVRLVPKRRARSMPADFSDHARTLATQYVLADELFRLRFNASSPNVGQPASSLDLGDYDGISLVGVQTKDAFEVRGNDAIEAGDVAIVRGDGDSVRRLAKEKGLTATPVSPREPEADLFSREFGVAEVVIPPRSEMIGVHVFPGMITESGDLVILAVQRQGTDVAEETELGAGDTLLLRGRWDALRRNLADPEVLVVDSPELVRRRTAPLGTRARVAIGVVLAMVVLLVTRIVPPAVVTLVAACAMILLRVVNTDQAYRSIAWSAVFLVAAMIPMSTAMRESGAAQMIAEGVVRLVHGAGPYGLLGGLFLLTATLGQVISNTATALIVAPIGISAASQMHVSARPILLTIAVAAAASFLTPIATPVNMMVQGPAGLRFGDYWKFGLPLLLWYFVVAVGLIPIIWPW